MRPRSTGPLRFIRQYSQSPRAETAKCLHKFSLSFRNEPTKNNVLSTLRKLDLPQKEYEQLDGSPRGNVVLLVTKKYASWLRDGAFMSGVLETVRRGMNRNLSTTPSFDVLSGVVDGVAGRGVKTSSGQGLSVLCGTAGMLPELWKDEILERNTKPEVEEAAITLSAAFPGQPLNSGVTMPLANTIFLNGQRSTLFASRYERQSDDSWSITQTQGKSYQEIILQSEYGPYFHANIPAIPLAPPRKIVAGLGNIVRQIEVDGVAVPASKELEMYIPQLLDARSRYPDHIKALYPQGSLNVWALVIPPRIMESPAFHPFLSFRPYWSESREIMIAYRSMRALRSFIHNGCRLHKILSGGGGWGSKQGLLSLDSETSYHASEEDDIETFIKSFQQRDTNEPSDSLVAPGSYILYFTPGRLDYESSRGYEFGVIQQADEGVNAEAQPDKGKAKVSVLKDHFGALTSAGLYAKLDTPGYSTMIQSYPFNTKFDVPNGSLWHP